MGKEEREDEPIMNIGIQKEKNEVILRIKYGTDEMAQETFDSILSGEKFVVEVQRNNKVYWER